MPKTTRYYEHRAVSPAMSRFVGAATSAPISRAEELELFKQYKAGDQDAGDKIMRANIRFAYTVAYNYRGGHLPVDELVSLALFGMARALDKFDASRGYKFITCAVHWIRQALQEGIARQSGTIHIPLNQQNSIKKYYQTRDRLRQEIAAEPSHAAILEKMEVGDRVGHKYITDAVMSKEGQLHTEDMALVEDGGESGLLDIIPDTEGEDADEATRNRERTEAIHARLSALLTDRERHIIGANYGLHNGIPATLESIGGNLGLTRERVRQIRNRALLKLKAKGADLRELISV